MATEKLKLVVLDGNANGTVVEVQFNPKEIDIQKAIPWQQQPGKGPGDLVYTHNEPRKMSCELLFDGSPTSTSIQGEIDKLQAMSDIDTVLKRPPKLKVVWGQENASGVMPKFEAVIEELDVKYVMFDPDGKPLRATAVLRLREARNLMVGKSV